MYHSHKYELSHIFAKAAILTVLLLLSITVPVRAKASSTLDTVNSFDYYAHSISSLSDTPFTIQERKDAIAPYGKYIGGSGMPIELYKEAMDAKWEDVSSASKSFKPVRINLTKKYTYNSLVKMLSDLSVIDGVSLFKIGESTQGRPMYAIEVDIPSDVEKETILLTGTVHARETAGCEYIIKQLAELLQSDSPYAREVLSKTRFVAVPCVNPDGREGICFNTEAYTYDDGTLWKATSSGIDLNRNFPGLSWSSVLDGYKESEYLEKSPGKLYYAGAYPGCSPETRAMMKFLYHYVVIEKAKLLVDYHQQGRVMCVAKPWLPDAEQERSKDYANAMKDLLNYGISRNRSDKYTLLEEDEEYGLNGLGTTLTDYACTIALGAKFSPAYGFSVYCSKVKEYPLVAIPRLSKTKKKLLPAQNPDFTTFSFEIGWGKKYLGYTDKARSLFAAEYNDFHYGSVLYKLSEMVCSQ